MLSQMNKKDYLFQVGKQADENMTEGDKSKNTQKTVKATSVKPGGVKDVKVKKYKYHQTGLAI